MSTDKKFKHKPITFNSNKAVKASSGNRREHSNHFYKKKDENLIDKEKENEISYLQPEILPYETMIECLKARGMLFDKIQKENIRKIVEKLFYKHITPKPQRQYKNNRKGALLRKNRKKIEKCLKIDNWEKLVSFKSTKDLAQSTQLAASSSTSSSLPTCDRLKSPPANYEKKAIKLSSSPSLSDIKIKSKKRRTDTDESSESKKIKIVATSSVSSQKRESDSMSPDTKKRKPISWP